LVQERENVAWRIMAAVDGTALTYEPVRPTQAPEQLGRGEFVTFWADAEFVVRSQDMDHPFYLVSYMSGGGGIAERRGGSIAYWAGDPDYVNVVPNGQFLRNYSFMVDPTYSDGQVVLVRAREGGSFRNVVLDCAGTIEGWQSLGGAL